MARMAPFYVSGPIKQGVLISFYFRLYFRFPVEYLVVCLVVPMMSVYEYAWCTVVLVFMFKR